MKSMHKNCSRFFFPALPALFCSLLILSCFPKTFSVSAASSEYVSCGTLEDLQLFFSVCKDSGLTSFSVQCEEELFRTLKENDFTELHRQELIAQIMTRKMSYYSDGRMEYSDVVYTEAPVSVCSSLADAEVAVLGYDLLGMTNYILLCTEDLYKTLFTDGYLFHLAARNGIEDIQFLGYSDWHLEITETSHFRIPYTYAKDGTSFLDALEKFHQQQAGEFAIVTDPAFLQELLQEDYRGLNRLLALGQIEKYKWNSRTQAGTLSFSETSFSDVPRILCESEEEMIQAIRQAGAGKTADFSMVITPELYESLTGNDKTPLNQLEKTAGMTGYEWRVCSSSLSAITYTNAEIAAEVRQLATLQEAMSYMEECTARLDPVIHLFCTKELYQELLEGSEWLSVSSGTEDSLVITYINDLINADGIQHCTISKVVNSSIITLCDIDYYPGWKILAALRDNTADTLSPQEQLAFVEALALAKEALQNVSESGARGQMQTAARIHDAIIERTSYLIDETTDEDDNAIGALVNGLANCDGYSDAFFLTASLAGLSVRCQHGDTWSGDSDNADSTHVWNLVEIDGSWMAVDVTWDDDDEPGKPSYCWFLAGEDRMNRTHFWNQRTTVPIVGTTDPALRPRREYTIRQAEDLADTAQDIADRQPACAEVFFEMSDAETLRSDLFQKLHRYGVGDISYQWNEEMSRLFLTDLEY